MTHPRAAAKHLKVDACLGADEEVLDKRGFLDSDGSSADDAFNACYQLGIHFMGVSVGVG